MAVFLWACVVSRVPGCSRPRHTCGAECMLPRYTSRWALTPNCEQMWLAGPRRDHSCLAARKRQFWGPRRSREHLDPAEEHLTLVLLAGRLLSRLCCCAACGGDKAAKLFISPLKWWGAAGQAMGGSSAFQA